MRLLITLFWWALFVAFCCGIELDRIAVGMTLFVVAVNSLTEYLREVNPK